MVKAEEVETLAPLGQVHDPGLGRFRFQTEGGQQCRESRERGFGLLPGRAHHHEIVSEPDQPPIHPVVPRPVEPMQVDVAQQRTDHAPLGGAGDRVA